MKKIIICIILLFTACEYFDKTEIECLTDYIFNEQIQILTFEDCFKWSLHNIKQVADSEDYAQSPEETYNLKTGDCEDLCLMTQYLLYNKLNIDSHSVRVNNLKTGKGHFVIQINNQYYEAIVYKPIKNFNQKYKITNTIPYCVAVWMAINYHYFFE